jgi:hypothetical protein
MSEVVFGRLEPVDPRQAWPDEARNFTPWLADNLDLLSEQLGLALELREKEHPVGRYSLDILAEDVGGRIVIIENQLAPSDHTHLGQLLTYCAGTDARVVVWVAPTFTDEHVAALEWLNSNTNADVGFFAVSLEVLRIGDSPWAPHFTVVTRPNALIKSARPRTAAAEWSWSTYISDAKIAPERVNLAKAIVDRLDEILAERQLPWQQRFRKGYVAYQRAGGYNVLVVDMMWNRPLRIAVKLPAPPEELGLDDPYPDLSGVWASSNSEWGWQVPTLDRVPDLNPLVDLAQRVMGASASETG